MVQNNENASISGYSGVEIYKNTGSLINSGTIVGRKSGIYFGAGGSVSNASEGVISGTVLKAIFITGGAGTVENSGVVDGNFFNGAVYLNEGGLVSNTASGRIEANSLSSHVVYILGGPSTVFNQGTISALSGDAVNVGTAGYVLNGTNAAVIGGEDGVVVGQNSRIVNEGTIFASDAAVAYERPGVGTGVDLSLGGSLTNYGQIYGLDVGVYVSGSAVLINSGTVNGSVSTGVVLGAGGIVNNVNGGVIKSGASGIALTSGGTVLNAGTIIGNNGTAVSFGGTGSNLVVLQPGYAFKGAVYGRTSGSNTLELASAASAGTVSGLGSEFQHFGTLSIDPDASWVVQGVQRGLAGTISGFAVGDTIDLTGVTVTGSSYANGILTLDESVGSATLDLPGTFTTGSFDITNVPGGTDVSVLPCFRTGTRITTMRGMVPVETLKPGDKVLAHMGRGHMTWHPVVWIGHRSLDCQRHKQPKDVRPVRIEANAFGDGRPKRALFLSPDHAVFIDNVLIPIRALINGHNVAQIPVETITYYHVELPQHGVLMAENLPCESYLDTGNRFVFANGGSTVQLHPDFGPAAGEVAWEARACAPLRIAGDEVDRIAARLKRLIAGEQQPGDRNPTPPRSNVTSDLAALLQPQWYVDAYPDAAAFDVDAAYHYAVWGWQEGRLPCPESELVRAMGLVDPGTLMFTMRDVVEAGVDPIEHFCTQGWRERRRPNPYFDTSWYAETHDVPDDVNPLLHYILLGESQGLPPSRHFDPAWYRVEYGLGPMESPLAHYLKHRQTQRFSPLPSFDVPAYVKTYAKTLRPDRDPYAHFLAIGQFLADDEPVGGVAA